LQFTVDVKIQPFDGQFITKVAWLVLSTNAQAASSLALRVLSTLFFGQCQYCSVEEFVSTF